MKNMLSEIVNEIAAERGIPKQKIWEALADN
jgi:hypothetical protein